MGPGSPWQDIKPVTRADNVKSYISGIMLLNPLDLRPGNSLFTVNHDVDLHIIGVGFIDGYTSGAGGVFQINEGANVKFDYSLFEHNYAESGGGDIFNNGGTVKMSKIIALNNHAEHPLYLGAINRKESDRNVILSSQTDIEANRIDIWDKKLHLSQGGFLKQESGATHIMGDSFSSSFYKNDIDLVPTNSSYLYRNHAHYARGAIYCNEGVVHVEGAELEQNSVVNPEDTNYIPSGFSTTPKGSVGGGAIAADLNCKLTVKDSLVSENFSFKNSAIGTGSGSELTVKRASFKANATYHSEKPQPQVVGGQPIEPETEEDKIDRLGATIEIRGTALFESSLMYVNVGSNMPALRVKNTQDRNVLVHDNLFFWQFSYTSYSSTQATG